MSFFKRLLSSGTDRDKRGDSYMYTSSDHQLGKAFAGRLSSDDVPDEDNGSDKSQNIDFKLFIDRSIKRLSHRYFETDANKRCLTYQNRQVITRMKRGTDRENAECEQYLFNLFHDDIPYILGALRAVKNLEVKDPYLHTSSKTAPVSVVGQSFSVDQNAISRRGSQNVEYQLEEKEKTIRILQRRYDKIAKSVDSSISTRYKTERNALLEEVEKFENAVNHCLQSYRRLVLRKVTIINRDTNKVDFDSIIVEIKDLVYLASIHGSSHRDEDLQARIEGLEHQITKARIDQNIAQEETKWVQEESNKRALIIQQLSHDNEEMRLEKQRQVQHVTDTNTSLLVGMNQIKVDYAKEKRETINEINRLNGIIEQVSRQLQGTESELRATKSSNTTLQNEIQQMKREYELKQQHSNKNTEALGDGLRNQHNFDNQSIGKQKITDLERRLEGAQNEYANLQMDMRKIEGRHEEEKRVMTLEINNLDSTIKQMKAERVHEKKHVVDLERQLDSARWDISVKTNAITALQTDMQQMERQMETREKGMTQEIEKLQRTINDEHRAGRDNKSQWERQNDDLERQLQKVKDSNASLQNSKRQLDGDHAKEKHHMSRHIDSLQSTIERLQADGANKMSEKKCIEDLERQLDSVQKDLNTATNENTQLRSKMRNAEIKLEETERKLAQESEKVKRATNDQREIEQKTNDLKRQLEGARNTNNALQMDIQRLKDNHTKENDDKFHEINGLNATIERLQADGISQKTEKKQFDELKRQLESARANLRNSTDENSTLQHKIHHMKSQFEVIEQRMAKEIENLKQILEDQRKLEQGSVSNENQKTAALEQQLETEKQAKASIQNEIRQIESRHAKDKEEINRLNAIIKDMEAEGQQTERKHKEELQRQFESSRREISVTQNANTTLQQQIQQMKSQFKEKEKSLTQEIEQLRHTINSHDQVTQDSNSQWSRKVNGLERQLELQNSTNASVKERFRQLEDEKEGLTREINRLNVINKDLQSEKVNRMAGEKHIKELEHRLESTKADLNAKAHECTSLHGKETRLKGHINSLNMEIAKYRSLQDQDKKSIAKLNTELSNSNAQLTECRKQNASFESATRHHKQKSHDIVELQRKLDYYQQNHRALQQSEQEARQQIRALEKRNSELESTNLKNNENAELLYEIDRQKQEIDQVISDVTRKQRLIDQYQKRLEEYKQNEFETMRQVHALEKRTTELVDKLNKRTTETSDNCPYESVDTQGKPLNVAEEYRHLLSNSWSDAKDALHHIHSKDTVEADVITILFLILQISEKEACVFYGRIMEELSGAFKSPIEYFIGNQPRKIGSDSLDSLPENIAAALHDFFRKHVDDVKQDLLVKDIKAAICSQWKDKSKGPNPVTILENARVAKYVTDCTALAWKMAIQKPPMYFDASRVGEDWIEDGYAELMPGSNPKAGNAKIVYYKHPALFFYDETLVKACVFVNNLMNA